MRARSAQKATARPVIPPSAERERLSINSCPMMRGRVAPMARRTAISFTRPEPRTSMRLARLAQAMSKTTPVVAIKTQCGLGLLLRDARLQPAKSIHPAVATGLQHVFRVPDDDLRLHHDGNEDFRGEA